MRIEDLDEYRGIVNFWIVMAVVLIAIGLGVVKVKNELRMTEMYERQAIALERSAERPHTERRIQRFIYICKSVPQYGQFWEAWLSDSIKTGACGRAR